MNQFPLEDLMDTIDSMKGPTGMVSAAYLTPNWISAKLLKDAVHELAARHTFRAVAFPPSACEKVVAELLKPLCK
jgi:hypothetical protein